MKNITIKIGFITLCGMLLFVTNGCSRTYFSISDPAVVELVEAIETYEQDHGYPPSTLDVLIPAYLTQIPHPRYVDRIVYEVDATTQIWTVAWEINDINRRCTLRGCGGFIPNVTPTVIHFEP